MKETWNKLLSFVKQPTDRRAPDQTLRHKGGRLFSVLLIDIVLASIAAGILVLFEETGLLKTEGHIIEQLMQQIPIWLLILLGVVIVPFVEELLFRLWLRLDHNYLLWPFTAGSRIFGQRTHERFISFIRRNWYRYYGIILYTSCVVFAVLHFSNYEYSDDLLPFIPVLVAPQFLAGLLMSYLRVRYGFIWGYFLHLLHNLIFLGIPLAFMDFTEVVATTDSEEYQMTIEEVFRSNTDPFLAYYPDSLRGENIAIKRLIPKLLHQVDKLVAFDPENGLDQRINISFNAYSDSLNADSVILNQLQQIYDFQVIADSVLQPMWQLQIVDSVQLMLHAHDTTLTSASIKYHPDKVVLSHAGIRLLAGAINEHYAELVTTNITLAQSFDFTVPKGSTEELKRRLREEYGLHLQESEAKVARTKIVVD